MRSTPSTIDRLEPEVQALIGELRRQGCTIDEILAKLRELDGPAADVSRSALGRHVKRLSDAVEAVQRSRAIAEALVSKFGETPDNKLQRANLELMHGVVMQTLTSAGEDDEGNPLPVTFDAEQVMFLARALQSLSQAERTNDDRIRKAEERALAKAVERVSAEGAKRGMTKDTVDFITRAVLGADS